MRRFTSHQQCCILEDYLEEKLKEKTEEATTLQETTEGATTLQDPKAAAGSAVTQGGQQAEAYRQHKLTDTMKFRSPMQGQFSEFSSAELEKAIRGLARKKAARQDGYMTEVYQNMPSLWEPIRQLCNRILTTGRLPLPIVTVLIVPLVKPSRDPELRRSKRPVSLITALSKELETAALRRMMEQIENMLITVNTERKHAYWSFTTSSVKQAQTENGPMSQP